MPRFTGVSWVPSHVHVRKRAPKTGEGGEKNLPAEDKQFFVRVYISSALILLLSFFGYLLASLLGK